MKKIYLIPAMIVPFIASIFYFNVFSGGAIAQVIYLSAKIFIFIYPLFFLKKLNSIKDTFRLNLKELYLGFTFGFIIFVAGYGLIQIPQIWQEIEKGTPFIRTKIEAFGVHNHYILMAIVISFIHSMLEEYYWRWFVFGASKNSIISATAFSLHHFVVLDFYFSWTTALMLSITVAIGGILFNYLYNRRKSIWGAWSAHVWADLFIFYIGYLLLNM